MHYLDSDIRQITAKWGNISCMLLVVFLASELLEARGIFIDSKRMHLINTGRATNDYSKEAKMTHDDLDLDPQHSNHSVITGLLISLCRSLHVGMASSLSFNSQRRLELTSGVALRSHWPWFFRQSLISLDPTNQARMTDWLESLRDLPTCLWCWD